MMGDKLSHPGSKTRAEGVKNVRRCKSGMDSPQLNDMRKKSLSQSGHSRMRWFSRSLSMDASEATKETQSTNASPMSGDRIKPQRRTRSKSKTRSRSRSRTSKAVDMDPSPAMIIGMLEMYGRADTDCGFMFLKALKDSDQSEV